MIKLIMVLPVVAFVAAGCMTVPVDDRPVVGGLHLGKNILSKPLAADARLPRGCTYVDDSSTKHGVVNCEQVRQAPVQQYVATPVSAPVVYVQPYIQPPVYYYQTYYGLPPVFNFGFIWHYGGRGHHGHRHRH